MKVLLSRLAILLFASNWMRLTHGRCRRTDQRRRIAGNQRLMKNLLIACVLLWPVVSIGGPTNGSMISAVSVLTIHVSDTNIHQSVFGLLTDALKLPVKYGPVMMGERRYAAVYAGNMFIEPCGPYSNMSYPVKDFEALFFGLNCGSDQAPSSLAKDLRRLNIPFEQLSPGNVPHSR